MKAADIAPPEPIVIGSGNRLRTFKWERLDPAKAQYGAAWGLRGPQGFAAIIYDSGSGYLHLTCCGLWTGVYPDSLAGMQQELAYIVRTGRNEDSDDRITKARFESWK